MARQLITAITQHKSSTRQKRQSQQRRGKGRSPAVAKATSADIWARLARGECALYHGNSCQGRTPCTIINGEPCDYFNQYVKPLLEYPDFSARYGREAKVTVALNPKAKVLRKSRLAADPALPALEPPPAAKIAPEFKPSLKAVKTPVERKKSVLQATPVLPIDSPAKKGRAGSAKVKPPLETSPPPAAVEAPPATRKIQPAPPAPELITVKAVVDPHIPALPRNGKKSETPAATPPPAPAFELILPESLVSSTKKAKAKAPEEKPSLAYATPPPAVNPITAAIEKPVKEKPAPAPMLELDFVLELTPATPAARAGGRRK